MQNTIVAYGVSPAFFISSWGEDFGPEEVVKSLSLIAELGFTGYQPEVFHPDRLADWLSSAASDVSARAAGLGLTATQFVAHFLGHYFTDADAMRSVELRSRMADVLRVCDRIGDIAVVTIPVFPAGDGATRGSYEEIWDALRGAIEDLSILVRRSGRIPALEILPGSVPAGSFGYLRLCDGMDDPPGFNLDTGHLHAAGEPVPHAVRRLAGRITGTHLCDNRGTENRSDAPGDGTIPWEATLRQLAASGYRGSYDVEIRCPAGAVRDEYSRGLHYLKGVPS